ncbi:MAG: hypothetical protein COU10_03290 [Candidatus Harrisonbacteria bacterium CG10_big_fil_rev_8_21_14_0_10_45_28]|uniref:GDP-mannose 4,6-dehydratase n=1 Tax=Candidatus Harrisonbacteria bacterium CG10_big_fil_rev_8_21_14_0_10_45_28 TaxID=1974586 RepID=A0A2H0UMP9_9BACT|nr:MAG: hypothetical protein COU10_03290 [Candidatus Harrisonbacteria bacterium CG10_big_fil_rev_8_21_14_0_10_45_28]
MADGLKANKCTYEFRNFRTNSATLAMGLWYLIDVATQQDINVSLETRSDGRVFYSLNILSPVDNSKKELVARELIGVGVSQREISRLTSISRTFIRKIQNGGHAEAEHYLRRETGEVKKLVEMSDYAGWFYDLTTSSGEFHCGVGRIHVHNSPRRGETFLTRKVTRGIARILAGKDEKIYLGNLNARRDWGYAPEYVEMMWMMLQQKNPEDYVVGTGENNSVGDFVREAFSLVGIDNWKKYVGIDPRYYRPTEVDDLRADISKAKKILKWEPQVKFKDLVKIMMKHDLEAHGLDELADKIVIKNKKALEAVEKRSKTERKVMRKLGKDGEA